MMAIPREAIEAGMQALVDPRSYIAPEVDAERVIVAAFPFLRREWEQELLSEDAVRRAGAVMFGDWLLRSGAISRSSVRLFLLAALDRTEEET